MASGWSRDPTEDQQRYYELLEDVYAYEPNTSRGLLILRRKVGYAMYGVPDEESNCDNAHTGYSEKKYKNIKAVVDLIMKVNKDKTKERDQLDMAIIFVFVEHEKQVLQFPVFRILLTDIKWKFVDTNCRVYCTWKAFLNCNELPEGKFCWPLNGIYSGDSEDKVELGWGITPAAQPGKKVVDKVMDATAIIATGAFLVSMFTPLGPIMAAASGAAAVSGAYSALTSIATLVDRGVRGQSVNPFRDTQALKSWMSVTGSVVGVAAGAATIRAGVLASKGQVLSRMAEVTRNALTVTSAAATATGAAIGTSSTDQCVTEREPTALDVLQFSASVLFLAHATISSHTVSQVINEIQNGVMENFENSLRSNRHRKQFKKSARNAAATADNAVGSNAKVIKGFRSIDNKDDFLAGTVRTRKDFSGNKAIFSENGNIVVNGGAEVHPMQLCEVRKPKRRNLLSLAEQAFQGKVSYAIFRSRLDTLLSTNTVSSSGTNTSQDSDAAEAVNTLVSQVQQGVKGITIGRNEVMFMLTVVDELTVLVCSKRDNKYRKWWRLIWHHANILVKEMCDTYDEALHLENLKHNFVDKRSFNMINGIQMTNVFMHFVCSIYKKYKDHIEELLNDTEILKTNYIFCGRCKNAM